MILEFLICLIFMAIVPLHCFYQIIFFFIFKKNK
uniref:Uncharacterized protein n=1 Tax=Wuchereria bancrofti TaxID=6293 RepID=A0AAF5Q280_WUCBA